MKKLLWSITILFGFSLLATGCSLFGSQQIPPSPPTIIAQQQATATPSVSASRTATPPPVPEGCEAHCVDGECDIVCPPPPTPSVAWELSYDGTPWATPVYDDPTTPEPYPLSPVDFSGQIDTYLLLGSDDLPHRDSLNTDAIMLVFVDRRRETLRVTAISLPRDLYVFIPGHGMGRINSAYSMGGFPMLEETLRYNFGIPITEGYVYMQMYAFRNFIDWLGGIDVRVEKSILDECSGGIQLNYLGGRTYHMSGSTALCYARARMTSNDFDRMRRQQEIMFAVARASVQRFGNDPAPFVRTVHDTFRDSITTNLSLAQWLNAGVDMARVDMGSDVRFAVMQPPTVRQWIKPTSGAYLLLPNENLQHWILRELDRPTE